MIETDALAQRTLVVVGQGYVGLPVSMRGLEVGYRVVGIDLDESRIDSLSDGRSYVEDVGDAEIRAGLISGRFKPTSTYEDSSGFDVAIVTVPTPLRDGLPDLTYIEVSGGALAPHIRAGATVILESTTYPGTTEELLAPILEKGSGLVAGMDFNLGYSPERIDPGNKTYGFVNTPKVVSGMTPLSLKAVQEFYNTMVDKTIPVSSCRVAELTKLLENTFRHVNIALVNELAMFAHDLGISIWEAIEASSTKPFGYMRFTPGPGVGGHCLPIDPSYLSWDVKRRLGTAFRFVELANDVNDHMPSYVVKRITAMLNDASLSVRGSRILLIGLAYKKNTGDIRQSPAVQVANLLLELGADVSYVDPYVAEGGTGLSVRRAAFSAVEFAKADLVVLLTDHDGLDYESLASARTILDCRSRVALAPNVASL